VGERLVTSFKQKLKREIALVHHLLSKWIYKLKKKEKEKNVLLF
jgi:hypothetical protein